MYTDTRYNPFAAAISALTCSAARKFYAATAAQHTAQTLFFLAMACVTAYHLGYQFRTLFDTVLVPTIHSWFIRRKALPGFVPAGYLMPYMPTEPEQPFGSVADPWLIVDAVVRTISPLQTIQSAAQPAPRAIALLSPAKIEPKQVTTRSRGGRKKKKA
jgi:hypothetical protein